MAILHTEMIAIMHSDILYLATALCLVHVELTLAAVPIKSIRTPECRCRPSTSNSFGQQESTKR